MITREAMEDNLYKTQADKKARALAKAEHQTRETYGANILNRAFNSSYTYGDAKELCATDHPNVSGGTFANELSTPAMLSEAAVEDMSIAIWAFTDDRGLKAALKPRKLIIPPAYAYEADRLFNSTGRVGTANNDKNTMKGFFSDGYVVNHYLTSTTAFFILTDAQDGLKYFERRAAEFKADNDFDTENAKFKVTARYVFGATDPRCIFGSTGV
jgi:phage major head subunit gpT-like protein